MMYKNAEYEYSVIGNNIIDNRIGNANEINNIKINDVSREKLIKVFTELRKIRTKLALSGNEEQFIDDFDIRMLSINSSPQILKGEIMEIDKELKNFVETIKENKEIIRAYIFKDFNKSKLWIISEDSTDDKMDDIFEAFLDEFDEEEYELMIFSNEVSDLVLKQIESITKEYVEVINNGCSNS